MRSAKWDITSKCNLRCRHCSVAAMYFDAEEAVAQTSLAQKLAIIDRLADGGVTNLSLLGGEPLTLGDELIALLDRAARSQIAVTIVTNGLLLNAATSRRLVDHGVAKIVVSIESPVASIHNGIRGKRTFERLIPNLEALVRLRNGSQSPKLLINTVLSRPNRSTFAQMIPFCRDLGADHWNALTLNYIGSADKNLDTLALSQEEHTEVALEIGLLLKSENKNARQLTINFAIICPLVWEYLCKRYDIVLPQPELCCSASTTLVYLSPAGEMYLCDRVHSSGYASAQLETASLQPVSLLEQTFNDIWTSRQFMEMFDFVKRAETYAGFEPCNRCKYLADGTCNPCPLQFFRQEPIRYEECLKAEGYLGDITRRDDAALTPWEEAHRFEAVQPPIVQAAWIDQVRAAYPVRRAGVRSAEQPNDEIILMHPGTSETIKLNMVGGELWREMTGLTTTEELVEKVTDLYRELGHTLKIDVSREERIDLLAESLFAFVLLLQQKGFVNFQRKPVGLLSKAYDLGGNVVVS